MAERIGIEEVLSELRKLHNEHKEGPAGFTTREMADALNTTPSGALDRLRELVRSGRVEMRGTRENVGISGKRCHTPVYGVVRQKGGAMPCGKGKKGKKGKGR